MPDDTFESTTRIGSAGTVRGDDVEALAHELAGGVAPPELLHRIAVLALEIGGASTGHMEQVDFDSNEVEVVAGAGAEPPEIGARVPYPGSLAENVLAHEHPEVLTPEEFASRPVAGILREVCTRCSALVIPLISEGQALGALILMRPVGQPSFTRDDADRIIVLGDLAALALRRRLLKRQLAARTSAAHTSEHRFRLLVEAVQDYAIYMLDPAGHVVSWNEGAARIKGYTAAEVLGRSFAIFHTPEDRAAGRPARALATAARDGVFREEHWRVRRGGERFRAHVTLTALHDDAGELLGFAKVTRDLTERDRAELALRESEERFRQVAENVREVFWLLSADLDEVLYVSPSFETVWGRSVDALQRDPQLWIEAVHPEDRSEVLHFGASLRERRAQQDFRIVRQDGEVRWLRSRGFPVRDAGGHVIRVGGVTEDVTDAREADDRLHFLAQAGRVLSSSLDYEETLRNVSRLAVPHVADCCVIDVLEAGSIRRLSVAHADPGKEEAAWEVARRYPPEAAAPNGVAHVLRTGEPLVVDRISDELLRELAQDDTHYRLLRELGFRSFITLPMRARGRTLGAISFLRSGSGRRYDREHLDFAAEIAGRAALAVDNARLYRRARESRGEAERRAAQEAALRQAAEGVSASFSVADVIEHIARNALVATNADGAFVKRIDADRDEVVVVSRHGTLAPAIGARGPYAGSYSERVIEARRPLLLRTLDASDESTIAGVLDHCDDCFVLIVPLMDGDTAIGTLVLARLPHRQEFRTDEVERAQTFADVGSLAFRRIELLRESESRRDELETATASRARLIRGFSHDLKNPLGAADGLLELLESGVVTAPEQQELSVSRARRAIRSALALIEDLSNLANAESGAIEVAKEPVDVPSIAADLVEEYRAQAEVGGLDVECRMPEQLPPIESDSARIRQILGNLLSNAVKYTERGGIRVSVAAVPAAGAPRDDAPGPGNWVAVSISDTGAGIPRDQQHLLFREFSRLGARNRPGAGLGLAISQRIAGALSGRITVSSEAGSGSTFTLWLPFREPA